MAPKTITVTSSGGDSKETLSNEEGYKNLVAEYHVASLKDSDGSKIRDFGSLVDGGRYTLGPAQLQQPNVEQSYSQLLLTMAPKKITVDGVGDVLLSDKTEYKDLLNSQGVQCLFDSGRNRVGGFTTLEDGGKYTLGSAQQHQQHKQPRKFEITSFDDIDTGIVGWRREKRQHYSIPIFTRDHLIFSYQLARLPVQVKVYSVKYGTATVYVSGNI